MYESCFRSNAFCDSRLNLPTSITLNFVAVQKMAAEWQPNV